MGVNDECLLRIVARTSAGAIVDRYGHDQEALEAAIARLVLLGLQGHERLFLAGLREAHAENGN